MELTHFHLTIQEAAFYLGLQVFHSEKESTFLYSCKPIRIYIDNLTIKQEFDAEKICRRRLEKYKTLKEGGLKIDTW